MFLASDWLQFFFFNVISTKMESCVKEKTGVAIWKNKTVACNSVWFCWFITEHT